MTHEMGKPESKIFFQLEMFTCVTADPHSSSAACIYHPPPRNTNAFSLNFPIKLTLLLNCISEQLKK
jgi:hypothetical protein